MVVYVPSIGGGFFGLRRVTSKKSNLNAILATKTSSIFHQLCDYGRRRRLVGGMTDEPPEKVVDWLRRPWEPECGRTAAHPNARFATPARECPVVAPEWEDQTACRSRQSSWAGVGVSCPSGDEAFDWQHGTFLASIMSSETTSAA